MITHSSEAAQPGTCSRCSQRRAGCTAMVSTSAKNTGPTSPEADRSPVTTIAAAASPNSTTSPRDSVPGTGVVSDMVTSLRGPGVRPRPASRLPRFVGFTRVR